jgi:hypothetical protein
MFQAGAVAPSSARLLHEETGPLGFPDVDPAFWEPFEPPVKAGDIARLYEGMAAEGFGGLFVRYALALTDPYWLVDMEPEPEGVTGAPDFFGPMADLKVEGLMACA